jgi:hypothetical protein
MISIAYNTPDRDYEPMPMPDTPENPSDIAALTIDKQNRYNLLTRKERLEFLSAWWALIPSILPCGAWRRAWSRAMGRAGRPPLEAGREAMMAWMWKIEEGVCANLRCPTPHTDASAMKQEVSAFESGCSVVKRGKTCRARKVARRNRVRSRRQKRGVEVL